MTVLLRTEPHNSALWYDLPDRLRHGLVWAESYDRESDPVREAGSRLDVLESQDRPTPAWRYSVVAPRLDGPEGAIRYGLTPETSKLNINVASEQQIEQLLTPILVGLEIESPQELINALLDWRDTDDDPRDGGAENEYYNNLDPGPAYSVKNGPLDTIEEILLIKGWSARLLYGEDVNRNGVLDENENDGEESFPYYDNADGVLNHGIAPFVTVFGREPDTSLDNKPRINLNADAATVAAQMAEYIAEGELSEGTIAFITQLKQQNFDFTQLASPADLYAGDAGQEAAAPAEGDADPNAPTGGELNPALAGSPVTLDELPVVMDRFSVRPPNAAAQPIVGLINVNTAPSRVLSLVPGMTAEMVVKILDGRLELEPDAAKTTAWLLTQGVLTPTEYRRIAPYITTKAYQIHVEIVGYADHRKAFYRGEWIIEMLGPLAQVKYHRDLTRLGLAWPVDDDTIVVTQ
ncbi:MAG: hypothetical protein D6744_12590 [Planctomycetota bacterium]|nr:MAG: hypothetical protein D6744_12590 [Planctomycetota bacterium]